MRQEQPSTSIFQDVEPLFGPDANQLPASENDTSFNPLVVDQLRYTRLQQAIRSSFQGFYRHSQIALLSDCIVPILQKCHPDGRYLIGQDCGIYWNVSQEELSLEQRIVTPAWFYIPNAAAMLDGRVRRLYHLWREFIRPHIVIELVTDDSSKPFDSTPQQGIFWLYERVIGASYYVIYDISNANIAVYALLHRVYNRVIPNERGHYPIASLNLELGVWYGTFQNMMVPWLRWYNAQGELLPTSNERAERLAEMLRVLEVDPDKQP